ncbi:uncharacterized protein LOC131009995 [Salvia miltiorrhiza]|uniref:uncharacterized protein LOC131009995 n=1 Tax=Salvia miltiorrhiza TaxID=226208 RepID=UPI0025AC9FDD|nr:uncharacterized protein LOC131009995 [Salvia miltiorrhiza]
MSNPRDSKLSLKVTINKQKSKVLFAQANNDFVDVLLSFLTLPLGKIVRILQHHKKESIHAINGSFITLYEGLHHLDSTHFSLKGAKEMFLNPRNPFEAECSNLILDITDSETTKFFVCGNNYCGRFSVANISMYSGIAECSVCGSLLNKQTSAFEISVARDANLGVFTKNSSSFLISDDLRVVPVEPGFLQTPAVAGVMRVLENVGVADTQGAESRILSIGIDDIMDLLRLSLVSATPLTDLIIKNGQKAVSAAAKPEPPLRIVKEAVSGSSKKVTLKASLQRSTNRFLFAEATDDFLELLFSFLTIPLGGVEFLLGGKACLNNIDNLYKSVTDFIKVENFKTPHTKNRLMNPKLAHGYISHNQFLPLTEEESPVLRRRQHQSPSPANVIRSFNWGRRRRGYVKKPTVCFVTDDLTVTPSLASTFSILNGLGIALSDVKEMELHIGLEEALSILKASLTSKTALTDALINPMLYKAPKLEK